ncbi:MAG: DUF2231 domain-containing protein [Bacteroidota bacterium]
MFNATHFHPMLVHFPIALITVGFVFDLVSMFKNRDPCLSRAGFWLGAVGMAGAVVAYGTGYFLTNPMEGDPGIMREKHQFFATIALVAIIVATLSRITAMYLEKNTPGVRYSLLGLFFIAFVFIVITGYLGGTLVMDYMIGL